MLFNEFGKNENPTLLLLHGMSQDWRSEYEALKPLEEHYRLIIPAQDGFYDGSGDFTTFADQARQIEEYVQEKYNGYVHGVYGASQGGLMITELLTRNRIRFSTAIMDGCYVAHQGRMAGKISAWMVKKLKNTGKLPLFFMVTMKLMGLKKEDLSMMDNLYLKASDESIDRNYIQNYTYRIRPEIAENETMVHMWCGSKEPYALKSHKELKKYLKNYREEIMEDLGHGDFLLKHRDECCRKIAETVK